MFRLGVRAYMRVAVLAVVLILAACSTPSKPLSSPQPSAAPTPILVTPTAPAAAAKLTWAAPVRVDHQPQFAGIGLSAVSCPGIHLCVAVGGNVLTSTNPTGGAGAWAATKISGANSLNGVSCPTIHLCVAVDAAGNVLTSSNPTKGAAAWKVTHVDGPAGCPPPTEGLARCFLGGVACPSTILCVAVDQGGNVVTSKNPTGGATAWKVTHVAGTALLNGVSCPTPTLCIAVGDNGSVAVSTNPFGGSAA